jgi:hypothetical protein
LRFQTGMLPSPALIQIKGGACPRCAAGRAANTVQNDSTRVGAPVGLPAWLWFLIAAVIVFILWAGRRAERQGAARPADRSGRPGSAFAEKPVGGKRRAH